MSVIREPNSEVHMPEKGLYGFKPAKLLEAPEWSAKPQLADGHLIVDVTRLEKSRDGKFMRMEQNTFYIENSLILELIREEEKKELIKEAEANRKKQLDANPTT